MEIEIIRVVNPAKDSLSVLRMLIEEDKPEDIEPTEGKTEEKVVEEKKPKREVRVYNKPSRHGFQMECSLGQKFLRSSIEKKFFRIPCSLRFVITVGIQTFVQHVFPMDTIGEYAHFKFKVYWNSPVRLQILHRNPEGYLSVVVDQVIMKEYIGLINSFGGSNPCGRRKAFQLLFIPWRCRPFFLRRWIFPPLQPLPSSPSVCSS